MLETKSQRVDLWSEGWHLSPWDIRLWLLWLLNLLEILSSRPMLVLKRPRVQPQCP